MRRRLTKIVIIAASSLGYIGNTWAVSYQVQSGDTLSEIAGRLVNGPVWGKSGSFLRILTLNSKLRSHPNLIYVGDTIQLPNNVSIAQTENPINRAPSEVSSEAPSEISPAVPAGFEEYSLVSVAPLFSFSRINSTDRATGGVAVLGSDLNFGLEIGWKQFWSNRFQTALLFSGTSEHYTTNDPSRGLAQSTLFLGSVDFGARIGEENWFALTTRIGISQSPFSRGQSSTQITLDSVVIPHAGLGISLPLYHSQVFAINLEGDGDYLVSNTESNYRVNAGYSLSGKLNLVQRSPKTKRELSADIYFTSINQNTTLTFQSEKEVGASFRLNLDFFGGDSK